MPYEVEMKFRVQDLAELRRTLAALGASPASTRSESDTYLGHPSRSFAQTDEALRVRQTDSRLYITYKGPKIDAATKTRTEIELELVKADVSEVLRFWEHLGFRQVREVRKNREMVDVTWQGRQVHACLDHVMGLGDFLELELSAESAQLEQSRQILKSLADKLGFQNSERRSYLQMLLEQDAATADTSEKAEDWSE